MKQQKRRSIAKSSKKKRFQPPVLTIYGDLRRLTKVKMGTMNDGAMKPMTKASGTNA